MVLMQFTIQAIKKIVHFTIKREVLRIFMDEMIDASEQVYFTVLNQKPPRGSLESDVAGQINLIITLKSWDKIDEPVKGFYGQVHGQEIFFWWQNHRDRLLKKN